MMSDPEPERETILMERAGSLLEIWTSLTIETIIMHVLSSFVGE